MIAVIPCKSSFRAFSAGPEPDVLELGSQSLVDLSPVDPLVVYKMGLQHFVVIGIWLTYGRRLFWHSLDLHRQRLFPDLITGGTIDLYLSKPLSRLRLFIIKYLTGLLFVALQGRGVFRVGSFRGVRRCVRAHEWKPSLFLAIPIVVCMFSYLFGFCVLLGVWSRSTIAAILADGAVTLAC